MKEHIERLVKEAYTLRERADKIDRVVREFQELCDHTHHNGESAMIRTIGKYPNKHYYICDICGYADWY